MKPLPVHLKSWVEVIEKALLVVTLAIGIAVSTYHGITFLGAKRQQAVALTAEADKRREVLDRFADTYLAQLDGINDDIRKLDEDLSKEIWKNTTGWDVKIAVRAEKAKDRQELLQLLGTQVLELKKFESQSRLPAK